MHDVDKVLELIIQTQLFTTSFCAAIKDKIANTGYVQLTTYFTHFTSISRKQLIEKIFSKEVVGYLSASIIDENQFVSSLEAISKLSIPQSSLLEITEDIGKTIISWLLFCNKQRYAKAILNEFGLWIHRSKVGLGYVNEKYIIKDIIDYYIIDDLTSFINVILNVKPKNKMFFRGQESINYWLQPSISRSKKLYMNESKLYQELILRCPNDFTRCTSHIDYLVEMQHYGLPTRLIDITTNPLVALYFAVTGGNAIGSGEVIIFDVQDDIVKYERSDTVSVLSCLPLFSYSDQCDLLRLSYQTDVIEFNKNETVSRLLHEIKVDKPAFSDRIIPCDLRKSLIVTPAQKNSRIVKQAGAFIIQGLVEHGSLNQGSALETLRYKYNEDGQMLIIIEGKEKIKGELKAINIHYATLFPEIDDVANYLKNEFL